MHRVTSFICTGASSNILLFNMVSTILIRLLKPQQRLAGNWELGEQINCNVYDLRGSSSDDAVAYVPKSLKQKQSHVGDAMEILSAT